MQFHRYRVKDSLLTIILCAPSEKQNQLKSVNLRNRTYAVELSHLQKFPIVAAKNHFKNKSLISSLGLEGANCTLVLHAKITWEENIST